MIDPKKWTLATAQLQAFRNHIPGSVKEELVSEYHSIVELFEQATGEDLSSFKIRDNQVAPRVASFRLGSHRHPGSQTLTKTKYCASDLFNRQVEGLAAYLPNLIDPKPAPTHPNDYDSLDNEQLEALARKHHIEAYGDGFSINRRIIIDALRSRDRAINTVPTVQHITNIHNPQGLILQNSPVNSPATLNYQTASVESIVSQVKAAMSEFALSQGEKSELDIEIRTLEMQLQSANPKSSRIKECLHSTRSILEGVAGSMIATAIVAEITKLLAS